MPGKRETDLANLLGGAARAKDIERPAVEEATQPHNHTITQMPLPTPVVPSLAEETEPRLNVAIKKSLHRTLKLYAVKAGRDLKDVTEEAIVQYLRARNEA